MSRSNLIRLGSIVLLGTLLWPSSGCKKASTDQPDTSNRPTAGGGLGFDTPPPPPRTPAPGPQINPQPAPQQPQNQPAPIDKTPNFGLPRPDLLLQSRDYLRQIGQAYKAAAITGPVNGPKELGIPDKMLKDPVGRPYVICFGIDINNLPSNTLLAWEAGPDSASQRRVVTVGGDVNPMSEADFAKAPKAKK